METDNLILDSDGDVTLKLPPDAEGDRDTKYIGFIDDCRCHVPAWADDEFDELLQAWARMQREDSGCLHEFEAAYFRVKGY